MIVLQHTASWLPQTMSWLAFQFEALPLDIVNHIVCEERENLAEFPAQRINCQSQDSPSGLLCEKVLRRAGLRQYSPYVLRTAMRIGPSIIHSHFGYTGWYDLPILKRIGGRHVVSFYGLDLTYVPRIDARWYERYKQMFAQVNAVLCEGHHMAQTIRELGCPDDKLRIHHLGIPLEKIPFRPRRWDRKSPLKVLIAATFREKKGIPDALNALALLRKDVALEVTVIGDATGEPRSRAEKERILDVVRKMDLADVTHFMGFQTHSVLLEEAYRHHIFLSPSLTASDGDTEGGAPVTIIEMAASGMPVVSTRHCDIPEVLNDGTAGLMASERDVEGLHMRLCELMNCADQWQALVVSARRHIEKEYDVRIQSERLYKLYRSLSN